MTSQQVEQVALRLPEQERLRLAWSLLNSLVKQNAHHTEVIETDDDEPPQNALMEWVGIYSSKSSDTARRAKEILLEEMGTAPKKRRPIAGSGTGLFEMEDNFDDPLEQFEPYM